MVATLAVAHDIQPVARRADRGRHYRSCAVFHRRHGDYHRFCRPGLIGFAQSLGVIYGVNIGTTVTGWIIMLVGVKLKLGVLALPVLFVASLMGILGEGQLARVGRMLAGLSLLFIGLDLMQAASVGVQAYVTPDWLPADGW